MDRTIIQKYKTSEKYKIVYGDVESSVTKEGSPTYTHRETDFLASQSLKLLAWQRYKSHRGQTLKMFL